jgi:hypothetical protein
MHRSTKKTSSQHIGMIRFGQMKPLALALTLSTMFAVAAGLDRSIHPVLEIDSDHHVDQVQELFRSHRHLQNFFSSCEKTSPTMEAELDKLLDQVPAAIQSCEGTTCNIDYASFSSYSSYNNACKAAKGALAIFTATQDCDILDFVFSNKPVCLVSKNINKNCGPKNLEDFVEDTFSTSGCSATAVCTSYTDFSGTKPKTKPVKKPIKKPVKKPARRA